MSQKNIYKRNLLIPALKILSDALAIEAAFLFSFYLRFYSPLTRIFPVTKGYPPFSGYLAASLILLAIYLIIFSVFRSYRSRYFSTFSHDITVVFKTCFLGILFAMSGAFLYRGFSYSRLTMLLVYLNTNLFLLISRYFFHRLRRHFMKRGYGMRRVILVGTPSQLPGIFSRLHQANHLRGANHLDGAGHLRGAGPAGFQFQGYLSEHPVSELDLPYLGTPGEVAAVVEKMHPDALLLVFDAREHQQVLSILQATEGRNVELFYVPDVLDMMTSRPRTLEIGGLPLLQLKSEPFSGWQGFLKRSFDLLVSATALIVLAPLFLLIALIIKLTSPGPVFYRQQRVGLDGREFTMLKFRSMVVDAEKHTGPVWAQKNDPRVTPIGRFLRRTSLDELPQLINVLKGEMSLVGPRPERKVFVEQFQRHIPKYAERHRVRSGMTGWAQVNGLRGQSPIEERTRYDVYYIENWSLWFDIKIILLTFVAIVKGENAY